MVKYLITFDVGVRERFDVIITPHEFEIWPSVTFDFIINYLERIVTNLEVIRQFESYLSFLWPHLWELFKLMLFQEISDWKLHWQPHLIFEVLGLWVELQIDHFRLTLLDALLKRNIGFLLLLFFWAGLDLNGSSTHDLLYFYRLLLFILPRLCFHHLIKAFFDFIHGWEVERLSDFVRKLIPFRLLFL